ncbi:hypothetical protein [Rhizobium sp.]
MLKFFSGLIDRLNSPADLDWSEIDLLQHPALARMNERELADLPFRAAAKGNAERSCPA